jgi:hypothetical protein
LSSSSYFPKLELHTSDPKQLGIPCPLS